MEAKTVGTKRPSPPGEDPNPRPSKRHAPLKPLPARSLSPSPCPTSIPKTSLQRMEEVLLQVERDQSKFAVDIKAMNLALDDTMRSHQTLGRAIKEMLKSMDGLVSFRDSWYQEVDEMRHLVRLGRRGIDLSDLRKED